MSEINLHSSTFTAMKIDMIAITIKWDDHVIANTTEINTIDAFANGKILFLFLDFDW